MPSFLEMFGIVPPAGQMPAGTYTGTKLVEAVRNGSMQILSSDASGKIPIVWLKGKRANGEFFVLVKNASVSGKELVPTGNTETYLYFFSDKDPNGLFQATRNGLYAFLKAKLFT